ncbi:uncharacterized protein N7498_008538 [Penicillium cinerascens]|uniref:GED domain-containing protein n=1 Tax=Penicillium cinerascens TaxID=70096 RepID=A0A9W9MAA3_9EURO|nr:uncharacterized protein N7498_008538 [Penicillium cinerascens]KAJ5195100.1 hypothetical protein N7498_008538 [Penicillium cinerascens]
MNSNSRNERLPQPESEIDKKINENAPMITIGAPSDHGSTDTEHQAPKPNSSKTEKTDRGPLSKGLSTQNKANPLVDLQSYKTSASLCKSKHTHTVDRMEPPPAMNSEEKFGSPNFKAEALHAQPKPAIANEAKSAFTFSMRMQDPPKNNAPQDTREGAQPSAGKPKLFSFNVTNTMPTTKQQSLTFQDPGLVSAFSDVPAEEYPKSNFFSSTFQTGLFLGLQLARESAGLMEQLLVHQGSYECALDSTQVNCQIKQMKRAGELNNFFNTETIAFLGSTLAGKSSVINSLLDFPRLATADDFGSAVTSIVTEYRQMKPSQSHRIQVEVEYLSGVAMKDHVNELLWSFRRAFLPDVAKDSLTAADLKEIKEAWSALESAFGNEKEFNRKFLSDKSEGAFEKIAEQLIKWTKTIPWPTDASDGKWVTYAETAEEFYTKTSLFMQNRIWPFTKIMRVYIDAPILRAGLVIADLPGLLDTSLAKVKAAQEYLSRCDRVFHVTDIRRALTNQLLETSLYSTAPHDASTSEGGSTKRWSRTAVICTMSDAIDEAGAERHLRSSGKVRMLEAMESIEDGIRKVETTKDSVLMTELQWKYINHFLLRQTGNLLVLLTLDRKKMLLIEARNRRVEDGLKRMYKSSQEEEDLNVFCVSNLFYGQYCSQRSVTTTHEKRTMSGIPALRKFCYSTLADSRLQEAKNFLLTTLPSALASIGLRSQSLEVGPSCSIKMILKKVDLKKKRILRYLERSKKNVQNFFQESVLKYAEIHHNDWQKAANQKGLEWLDLSWVDYQAFCRKNGRHLNLFNKPVDWNSELIEEMRLGLSGRWNGVERSLSAILPELHGFIENCFRELRFDLMGPGKAKALREKVQGRIENGTLFPNIMSAVSCGMKDASQKAFDELATKITDGVIAPIIGDIHSVYSTITLAKKPIDECEGKLKDMPSLEMLQLRCRYLDQRYKWIIKQIE